MRRRIFAARAVERSGLSYLETEVAGTGCCEAAPRCCDAAGDRAALVEVEMEPLESDWTDDVHDADVDADAEVELVAASWAECC